MSTLIIQKSPRSSQRRSQTYRSFSFSSILHRVLRCKCLSAGDPPPPLAAFGRRLCSRLAASAPHPPSPRPGIAAAFGRCLYSTYRLCSAPIIPSPWHRRRCPSAFSTKSFVILTLLSRFLQSLFMASFFF